MKTIKINQTIIKEIIASEDGSNTYEFSVSFPDYAPDRKTAIFVMLYPTRNKENLLYDDSTLGHLIQHMDDLNIGKIRIVNLFSRVVLTGKMSYRGLKVDEENLQYIAENVKPNPDKDILVFATGSSMSTSIACNETKKKIYELFKNYPEIYQLHDFSGKHSLAIHPLWCGIRFSNTEWSLEKFPIQKAIKALPAPKPVIKSKTKLQTAAHKEK